MAPHTDRVQRKHEIVPLRRGILLRLAIDGAYHRFGQPSRVHLLVDHVCPGQQPPRGLFRTYYLDRKCPPCVVNGYGVNVGDVVLLKLERAPLLATIAKSVSKDAADLRDVFLVGWPLAFEALMVLGACVTGRAKGCGPNVDSLGAVWEV
jgi:hypothetical protein